MYHKRAIIPIVLLCLLSGCTGRNGEKTENAEDMLYLSALQSGNSIESEFTVKKTDIVTKMVYEAELINAYSTEVHIPDLKADYYVKEHLKKDGDTVRSGDEIMTITGKYDEIDKKEYELELERLSENLQRKTVLSGPLFPFFRLMPTAKRVPARSAPWRSVRYR